MSTISLRQKLGYGMGHVLNDLCASMWFTYLLLYYHKVLYFNNTYAGVVLLVGQIADGLSTTFVGLLSDGVDNTWICRLYGRRKSWHLVGSLCVLGSFPFIFLPCIQCTDSDQWAQLIYFSAFVIIFQFGWAAVQISHLSIIPDLAQTQDARTGLTAIRYTMTVLSNMSVYLVALAIFGLSEDNADDMLSDKDSDKFRNLMLFCVGLGTFTTVGFHVLVKEELQSPEVIPGPRAGSSSVITVTTTRRSPTGVTTRTDRFRSVRPTYSSTESTSTATASSSNQSEEPSQTGGEDASPCPHSRDQKVPVSYWFTEPQFYLVGAVYMFTRLFVNLAQAYVPLYLQESLKLKSIYIAIIPLVMFISGFLTSLIARPLNRKAGRKMTYLMGASVGVGAAIWVYFGAGQTNRGEFFRQYGIFLATIMYGSAGTTIIITSLSLTAELIGRNTETSAFVYGAMSLTDKFSNGIAVMIVQYLVPCIKCCPACRWFYRDVLFYATGGAALLGSLFILILVPFKVGQRRFDRTSSTLTTVAADDQEEGGGRSQESQEEPEESHSGDASQRRRTPNLTSETTESNERTPLLA